MVFVSHRWVTTDHPDPNSEQLAELRGRLETIRLDREESSPYLIFYDYCSMPQRPRSSAEELEFRSSIWIN